MKPKSVPSIGVSPATYRSLQEPRLIDGAALLELDPASNGPDYLERVVAIWRRQHDPTSWVTSLIPRLPSLRWVHTDTVGVERLPLKTLSELGIILTNARGAFAVPMAEWILCTILMSAKHMPRLLEEAQRACWAVNVLPSDLRGRTVMILGFGSVGRAVTSLCHALGMRVFCVRRSPRPESTAEATVFSLSDDWRSKLAECDVLVVALPLTAETHGLVDHDVLSRLRPGAQLINVARAQIVDEEAMIAGLRAGRLREAWLDVFSVEPLPANDLLWKEPNIYITPHRSAIGESNESATRLLFLRELQSFLKRDEFSNYVDLSRGY